jgi:hypothetical protein
MDNNTIASAPAPTVPIRTWRQRLGLAADFPLFMPTDVERAMVAEIADLRAAYIKAVGVEAMT